MKRLNLIEKTFLLKKTPPFTSLELNLLLPIADKLVAAAFGKGETIFQCNETAHRMYLIAEGIVEVYSPEGQLMANLYSNDFFGDESLFSGIPRGYTAVSKTETQLLALSETHLLTIISECPDVALGFLQVYTATMRFRPRKFTSYIS